MWTEMDGKTDELIRRNRTLLRLAKAVRTRTEELTDTRAERGSIGRRGSQNQALEDPDRLARRRRRNATENPS